MGIVHAVAGFLSEHDCNIVDSAQFGDPASQRFFMRVAFVRSGAARRRAIDELRAAFRPIAATLQWKQLRLLCVRRQRRAIPVDVVLAKSSSNHPTSKPLARVTVCTRMPVRAAQARPAQSVLARCLQQLRSIAARLPCAESRRQPLRASAAPRRSSDRLPLSPTTAIIEQDVARTRRRCPAFVTDRLRDRRLRSPRRSANGPRMSYFVGQRRPMRAVFRT